MSHGELCRERISDNERSDKWLEQYQPAYSGDPELVCRPPHRSHRHQQILILYIQIYLKGRCSLDAVFLRSE